MAQNAHMITATYMPATGCKGARVKLHSDRYNESIIFSYDDSFNNISDMAVDWLQTRGADVICTGSISKRSDAIAVYCPNGRATSLKEIKAGALIKGTK
jgi:hypothetical protein